MPCNEEPFEAAFIAASGRAWTGLDEAIVGMGQMLGAQRRGELYPWDLFRRSKFYADLKSSRRVAEFEYAAEPGNWARKKKRVLPAEF